MRWDNDFEQAKDMPFFIKSDTGGHLDRGPLIFFRSFILNMQFFYRLDGQQESQELFQMTACSDVRRIKRAV